MDTTQFQDWEDIKSDMNGTYPHILRTCAWTIEIQQDGSLNKPVCKVITKKKPKKFKEMTNTISSSILKKITRACVDQ